MPPTETKSYTPGAERAAREVVPIYSDQATRADETERVAALISRETHDAEMLEALKMFTKGGSDGCGMCAYCKAEAVIAKVEGQ